MTSVIAACRILGLAPGFLKVSTMGVDETASSRPETPPGVAGARASSPASATTGLVMA
jgi:hypothetical protein